MDDAGRRARNRGAVGATTHEHGTVKERRERDEATKRMVRLACVQESPSRTTPHDSLAPPRLGSGVVLCLRASYTRAKQPTDWIGERAREKVLKGVAVGPTSVYQRDIAHRDNTLLSAAATRCVSAS